MTHPQPSHQGAHAAVSLTRFAWLSIGAALLTITLKTAAYLFTGSVGLLSDTLESGVNLIAAVVALAALSLAARPPDEEHNFGHDKAEYFSSGVEGVLIVVAAIGIITSSLERLFNPQAIDQVGIGLAAAIVASLINLGVAQVLRRAGTRYNSITLEADSQHLMTDVWTSVGVVLAVAAVAVTGWLWLDAIIGLVVAVNIIIQGVNLVRRSFLGLMDSALPPSDVAQIEAVLKAYSHEDITWHALRTRASGRRQFASVHLLVPSGWTVKRGHDLIELVEADIRKALPAISLVTHLEPQDDPASLADIPLDRGT